jgi:hypothetical protein
MIPLSQSFLAEGQESGAHRKTVTTSRETYWLFFWVQMQLRFRRRVVLLEKD